MRAQSITILGGTGFLGTRLVARLIKDGRRGTVLSRDREQHKHLLVLPGLTLKNCDVYDEAQLSEYFRGKDVVINLVGILNERGFGGAGFRRAHTELTLDGTILKPSVMFGPGDSFLNRFAGLLAAVPLIFPLAKPNARFQPVLVDDVIEALLRCLHGGAASRQTYELGGPQVYSLREIVGLVAKLTGQRRWIVGLPDAVAYLQALAMNFVPGRPFSSDNYRSLTIDSVCADDGFAKLGLKPQSMVASARQYLGALEDNARLSHNRTSAGRSTVVRQ